MKICTEHYDYIKQAILPLKEKLASHREALKSDTRVHDIEMRLRWDALHATGLNPWICNNLYPYLNDTHIDTALRQIMREILS